MCLWVCFGECVLFCVFGYMGVNMCVAACVCVSESVCVCEVVNVCVCQCVC